MRNYINCEAAWQLSWSATTQREGGIARDRDRKKKEKSRVLSHKSPENYPTPSFLPPSLSLHHPIAANSSSPSETQFPLSCRKFQFCPPPPQITRTVESVDHRSKLYKTQIFKVRNFLKFFLSSIKPTFPFPKIRFLCSSVVTNFCRIPIWTSSVC